MSKRIGRRVSGRRALAALVPVVVAGCGAEAGANTDDAADGFPVTVENCGFEVVFEEPPARIAIHESAPVTILDGLGVLDSAVLRAGAFPEEYFDADTFAAIQSVPSLAEDIDESGHFQISIEAIIDAEPDLVFGLPDGITREGLADVGIAALEQPVYCPAGTGSPSFEAIYEQVDTYGRIFGKEAEAAEFVEELRDRVGEVRSRIVADSGRTAAVLYPTVGGGSGYAYGNRSMAQPQLEAAGFVNVFADVDERVFEITLEQLINRDPDVLVLLHVDGEPGPVKDAVLSLPGAEALTAVQNDDILVQLFNFTEPPTPVSIAGLERIADRFLESR